MAKARAFPQEFESGKPVYFYPPEPASFAGDILEIGPGRGDVLLWFAQQFPQQRMVGIELNGWRFKKLSRRAEKRGLTNVLLVKGNARIVIPRYFSNSRFSRIFVLFPDPWPKDRHAFHRLLTVEFLHTLSGILADNGQIVLATDEQFYADWAVENLRQVPSLVSTSSPYATKACLAPYTDTTLFEEIWTKAGKGIYYVEMRRAEKGE